MLQMEAWYAADCRACFSCIISSCLSIYFAQVYRLREGLGIATNNVAEYRSLILGLKVALQKRITHISVKGDSKLVCMQVSYRPLV